MQRLALIFEFEQSDYFLSATIEESICNLDDETDSRETIKEEKSVVYEVGSYEDCKPMIEAFKKNIKKLFKSTE